MKNKLYDIKQKVLKRYVGTFCEASNENEACKKIREILTLDDFWESTYKIEDFSNNVTVTFTNGTDAIEVKFISTIGGATSYSILVNEKRIATKDESDDVKNIIAFLNRDKFFKDDLMKVNSALPKVEPAV